MSSYDKNIKTREAVGQAAPRRDAELVHDAVLLARADGKGARQRCAEVEHPRAHLRVDKVGFNSGSSAQDRSDQLPYFSSHFALLRLPKH